VNPIETNTGTASEAAKRRLLSRRGEPLFIADWERVLMIHFEVAAGALQGAVPFQLDLRDRRAFISLVAFTMCGMRPRAGGRLVAWLFKPIATHHFLNVRTYVRHGGEAGIHFLAEWLSSRLAVRLGPATFGLPYRPGNIRYDHDWERRQLRGRVADARTGAALEYRAGSESGTPMRFTPCEGGSLDEWLMERYTAFTCWRNRKRFFRIWHPPWPQCPVKLNCRDDSLLKQNWPWFADARTIGANFSPGVCEVWMGCPHFADSTAG
jgi:uncharacterized protein YqjF (DUF2071 family)